jgi:hypothetical protein
VRGACRSVTCRAPVAARQVDTFVPVQVIYNRGMAPNYRPRPSTAPWPLHVVCTLLLAISGCAAPVDLKQALEIIEFNGGWYDAGVVAAKNKLIPSVSFRVRKKADVTVDPLALNVLFRAVDGLESSIDQDVFLQRVQFEGDTTSPIVVRPENGYLGEGEQTRAQMLQNSQFRDMRVTVFGKHSSSTWVELGRYDIPRQLLTK